MFISPACVPVLEFPSFLCGHNVLWPPGEHSTGRLWHGFSCELPTVSHLELMFLQNLAELIIEVPFYSIMYIHVKIHLLYFQTINITSAATGLGLTLACDTLVSQVGK